MVDAGTVDRGEVATIRREGATRTLGSVHGDEHRQDGDHAAAAHEPALGTTTGAAIVVDGLVAGVWCGGWRARLHLIVTAQMLNRARKGGRIRSMGQRHADQEGRNEEHKPNGSVGS